MKPALTLSLVISMLCPSVFAQGKEIRYDPIWDTALLGLGSGCATLGHFLLDENHWDFPALDKADLSPVDAAVCLPFDEGLSRMSIGTECLTLLWPSLFAMVCDDGQALPAAGAYIEALSFTFAAKDLLKFLLPKARPYAYEGGDLSAELLDEVDESFPSGHSALAFCAATSFAVLACDLAPDRPSTPWLVAGGYCLAVGTSALRVASGNHFPSDVVAGALLGSGIGWLVTKAHIRPIRSQGSADEAAKLGIALAPSAFLVKLSL